MNRRRRFGSLRSFLVPKLTSPAPLVGADGVKASKLFGGLFLKKSLRSKQRSLVGVTLAGSVGGLNRSLAVAALAQPWINFAARLFGLPYRREARALADWAHRLRWFRRWHVQPRRVSRALLSVGCVRMGSFGPYVLRTVQPAQWSAGMVGAQFGARTFSIRSRPNCSGRLHA
jgi:hypothetical protein